MPETQSSLARRYRKLLLCYPRAYRRERGDEIVDTMLERAPAGRTRPTVREATNLLAHGMRCRLGRPASRTVVALAVLAAVMSGMFGAALAATAASLTAPLPEDEAAAIARRALPDLDLSRNTERYPGTLGASVDIQVHGSASAGGDTTSSPDIKRQVKRTVKRLRADGWRVGEPVITSNNVACAAFRCDSGRYPLDVLITAYRGDKIIRIAMSEGMPNSNYQNVYLSRVPPAAAVYIAAIGGGVLAALAGWLAFGWASRRTEGRRVVSALALVSFGIAVLWWGIVMVAQTPADESSYRSAALPLPVWVAFLSYFWTGLAVLLALAVAALPRRRGTQTNDGAAATV